MNKLKNNYNIKSEQHPFHLVDPSLLPIITSVSLTSLVLGFIMYFDNHWVCPYVILVSLVELGYVLSCWFYSIIVEATYEGHHTMKVRSGIRFGMILFICSEIMFFFSFFWAFFHSSINPSIFIGCTFPPEGIEVLDPWGLPLCNTMLLLSSSATVTLAHKALLVGNRYIAIKTLVITVCLGILFLLLQLYEYNLAPFSISDSIYGSLFYICTGFHGLHVLVGTIFLIVCLWRQLEYHFTKTQHVGFELAAMYWHFVDVVWLFLYLVIYL